MLLGFGCGGFSFEFWGIQGIQGIRRGSDTCSTLWNAHVPELKTQCVGVGVCACDCVFVSVR